MKIIEALMFSKDAEEKVKKEIPFTARCFFNTTDFLMAGDTFSITSEGDFADLKDAREATEWLVDQLGGKVKWTMKHIETKNE
jgi:hypothetical protein